jgi:serine protease
MRTPLVRLTVGLLVLALGGFYAHAQERTPEEVQLLLESRVPPEAAFVPGEVIVKMRPTLTLGAEDLSMLRIQKEKEITSGGEIIYRIEPPVMATMTAEQARDRTMEVVRELQAKPNVEYAQPNYILHIADTTPNDPRYPEQWHYFNNGTGAGGSPGGIGLPQAWDQSIGDGGIVVAVVDTGILPNHPDIAGSPNLVAGYDMISDPATANDGDGRDNDPTDPGDAVAPDECYQGSPGMPDSWHGTHVAGTIGVGRTNNGVGVAGINWNVSVQAVRVLGKCGGTTVDINDGIRWAAGLPVPGVPNNATPARVINMSLGTPPGFPCSQSPSTQAAINDAVTAGATVVVAAGNDATDASQVFPASCDNVITVAASDYRGYLVRRYSNYGNTVEIMAPGGDVQRDDNNDGKPDGVLSMVHPNAGTYAWYNGTSMAAPHVAGAAALLLAQDPALSPADVLTILQDRALPRTSTECPQPCGAGLLSALGGPHDAQPAVSLVLDPDKTLNVGESTMALATVTASGSPQAGKTVTFSTGDPAVASVSPGSAVTNASGEAQATVKGEAKGQTSVTAAANGASDSVPVKVPDLSFYALALLLVAVVAAGMIRRRKVVR